MNHAIFEELLASRRARRPVALVTLLASGTQALVYDEDSATPGLDDELVATARQALAADHCCTVSRTAGDAFVHVFAPPRRLLIVGAVHIAQALAPMALLAGYEVTVIDPRRAFATDSRFPSVQVIAEWPDRALHRLAPDRRTAIVTLTHDAKLDEPALKAALASKAFYIGALGSKKTQAARRERLLKSGLSEQSLARIHGPAGLSLGAATPPEIALSILAQLTQVLRQGAAA